MPARASLRKPVRFQDKIILPHANWSAIHGCGIIRSPEANSSVYNSGRVARGKPRLRAASIAVGISSVLKYIIIRLARRLNKWRGRMRLDRIPVIKFIRGRFINHSRHWHRSPVVICTRCLSDKIFLPSSENTKNGESVKSTRAAT